jgi:hypothetical protein
VETLGIRDKLWSLNFYGPGFVFMAPTRLALLAPPTRAASRVPFPAGVRVALLPSRGLQLTKRHHQAVARSRRTRMVNNPLSQANAFLAKALKKVRTDKFDKMIVFLGWEDGQRTKYRNALLSASPFPPRSRGHTAGPCTGVTSGAAFSPLFSVASQIAAGRENRLLFRLA